MEQQKRGDTDGGSEDGGERVAKGRAWWDEVMYAIDDDRTEHEGDKVGAVREARD